MSLIKNSHSLSVRRYIDSDLRERIAVDRREFLYDVMHPRRDFRLNRSLFDTEQTMRKTISLRLTEIDGAFYTYSWRIHKDLVAASFDRSEKGDTFSRRCSDKSISEKPEYASVNCSIFSASFFLNFPVHPAIVIFSFFFFFFLSPRQTFRWLVQQGDSSSLMIVYGYFSHPLLYSPRVLISSLYITGYNP